MTRRRDLLSLAVLNAVGAAQGQPVAPAAGQRRLVVLLLTRRALGLALPQSLLARADEVIE